MFRDCSAHDRLQAEKREPAADLGERDWPVGGDPPTASRPAGERSARRAEGT